MRRCGKTIEATLGPEPLRILERSARAISLLLNPIGATVGDSLGRDEGILYAAIDLAECVEPKQFHDVVGYYNRFDIFALTINRAPLRPATFVNDPPARRLGSDSLDSEYLSRGYSKLPVERYLSSAQPAIANSPGLITFGRSENPW